MSYSRWYNSTWYTFWSASTGVTSKYKWPTKKLKYQQVFEICDFPSYYLTYGELEEKGIYGVMSDIRKFYNKPHDGQMFSHWEELEDERKKPAYQDVVYSAKKPTEEELRELMGYISKWREDVDRHFKFTTFMEYEWYYPIRNKIIRLWKKTLKRS